MKKVFAFVAVAAVLLVAGKASAQLSVNGGFLTNSISNSYKIGDKTIDTVMNGGAGAYLGLSYNIAFTEHWGVEPGVYVNYVGNNEKKGIATITTDMIDLNVPVLFNYRIDFTDYFGIIGFVGPNFRYGLSANSTTKYSDSTPQVKYDLYTKSAGASQLNRFDIGLMFGVGVHFNQFQIRAGYNLGLVDRNPEKDITAHYHNIFAGIGYAF